MIIWKIRGLKVDKKTRNCRQYFRKFCVGSMHIQAMEDSKTSQNMKLVNGTTELMERTKPASSQIFSSR